MGPLPVGAWVAVVAIGGGLAYYGWKHNVGAGNTSQNTSGIDPNVGVGGGGFDTVNPPASTPTDTSPITNEEWAVKAINWLIAQGYNPAVSDSAIRKYLAVASNLSTQEYVLVSLALQHLGSPPQPLPPSDQPISITPEPPPQAPAPVPTPTPPPKPVTPPHTTKTVTVGHWPNWDGSLWGIANHYGHPSQWGTLYSLNKTVIEAAARAHGHANSNNGNLIYAGTVLTLPAGW